jgi:hypothetical protein
VFWWGNLRENDNLGDPGVNGRILRWISGSVKWEYELDRAGSGQGQVAGTCGFGNELPGSIKCGDFLDLLKTG